jgi:hypothetical protein
MGWGRLGIWLGYFLQGVVSDPSGLRVLPPECEPIRKLAAACQAQEPQSRYG